MWLRITDEENALSTKALAGYSPHDQRDWPHAKRVQLKLAAVARDRRPSVRLTNKELNVLLDAFNEYDAFNAYEEEVIAALSERACGRG